MEIRVSLNYFVLLASGICYYTSLRKCCNTLQSGGIEVPGGATFTLGSTEIRVTFLHAGGFGSPPPGKRSFIAALLSCSVV